MRSKARLLAIALCLCACDSGGESKEAAAAKAKAEKEKQEQDKTDASIAKRKTEREAKAKADAQADENRVAELKRLCVIPDPPPKKAPSCQDVGDAHDAFVRRVGDSDLVGQWDAKDKESEMPMTIVRCSQADSNKVAMCQKHALDNAGADMVGHETELLQRCIDEFGKGGGRAGVVPGKPGRIPPKPGG